MIYLDNAATSFPKPRGVIDEMARCMRQYCGNPGRGSHAMAMAAAEKIFECREACVHLFGSPHPENLIFTMNTTVALNMAIKGLLRQGDHVLISDMEHNAVFRPVYKLAQEGRITYDIFPTMTLEERRSPARICAHLARLVRPKTRMLICAHASNICSASLPLKELGEFCRKRGILFVVDGAQSAGRLPIDVERMHIDALCVPGHKGLLGPQGSGFLLLGDGIVADTIIEGGSGLNSLEGFMPEDSPERYEAGTLPTPAIAGLLEGVRAVERIGISRIASMEDDLASYLQSELLRIPGITVYAPQYRGGVLLFNKEGISADRMGALLNERGFCVRAGYHCSALGHATLRTPAGGAVRVSPGIYNTRAQLSAFADAVERISPV